MSAAPLDPDEVACPTCDALPGKPCLRPDRLTRATSIHVARRRVPPPFDLRTASGVLSARDLKASPTRRRSPATPEGRAKGQRAGGAATARVRKEQAATVAAIVGEVRATALLEHAAKLGADAVRWDRDRMTLKRLALDAALNSGALLGEYLEAARRVVLDPNTGRPVTVPTEQTKDGRVVVVDVPDARGYARPVEEIKATAETFAKLVGTVRLEEGLDAGKGGDLGAVSDEALLAMLERARQSAADLAGPGA